jgi:hypothetical protein
MKSLNQEEKNKKKLKRLEFIKLLLPWWERAKRQERLVISAVTHLCAFTRIIQDALKDIPWRKQANQWCVDSLLPPIDLRTNMPGISRLTTLLESEMNFILSATCYIISQISDAPEDLYFYKK